MKAGSKPVPPGTPPPSPPPPQPGGPTNPGHPHPAPSGPPRDTAADLDSANLLLRTVELLAGRRLFAGVDLAHSAAARQRFIAGMRMVRLALAEAADFKTSARRDVPTHVTPTGGPVRSTRMAAGEEPAPGSAVAVAPAARVSGRSVVEPAAGVDVRVSDGEGPASGLGVHQGASGRVADAGFTLPRRPGLPRFDARPSAGTLATVAEVLRAKSRT